MAVVRRQAECSQKVCSHLRNGAIWKRLCESHTLNTEIRSSRGWVRIVCFSVKLRMSRYNPHPLSPHQKGAEKLHFVIFLNDGVRVPPHTHRIARISSLSLTIESALNWMSWWDTMVTKSLLFARNFSTTWDMGLSSVLSCGGGTRGTELAAAKCRSMS